MNLPEDTELSYLLTAYLFGDLSDEGVAEVEARLKVSEDCRIELERLRRTLALAESVYGPEVDSEERYSFETRRRLRVLERAQRKRPLSKVPLRQAALWLIGVGLVVAAVMIPTLGVFVGDGAKLAKSSTAAGSAGKPRRTWSGDVSSGFLPLKPAAKDMPSAAASPEPSVTDEAYLLEGEKKSDRRAGRANWQGQFGFPSESPAPIAAGAVLSSEPAADPMSPDLGARPKNELSFAQDYESLDTDPAAEGAPEPQVQSGVRLRSTRLGEVVEQQRRALKQLELAEEARSEVKKSKERILRDDLGGQSLDKLGVLQNPRREALTRHQPEPEELEEDSAETIPFYRYPGLKKEAASGGRGRDAVAETELELRYRTFFAGKPSRKLGTSTREIRVPQPVPGDEGLGRQGFREKYGVNPFVDPRRDPESTFSMDVDTASYTRARQELLNGRLPDPKTIRVEEFINSYRPPVIAPPTADFACYMEGAPSPFGPGLDLLRLTIKARELKPAERRPTSLTLAIDTSGSMASDRRLELIKRSIDQLVLQLEDFDTVAIVAFGSEPFLVLPPTLAREENRILEAIQTLEPSGETDVQAGVEFAYEVADEFRTDTALSRVMLLTDGVATQGAQDAEKLLKTIRFYSGRSIYLSVVGVGDEEYNDALLEKISGEGNGQYAYVDNVDEATKLFGSSLPSALEVLAQDAKVQVTFDPENVRSYRLLGYENRDIRDEDFRNDSIDAAEVGPGSTVTVLFEVDRHEIQSGRLGKVNVRYFSTRSNRVEELEFSIDPGVFASQVESTQPDFLYVACLAEFAELLRESYWSQGGSYSDLRSWVDRLPAAPSYDAAELKRLVAAAQINFITKNRR